jgi:hypothetical protein
MSFDRSRGARTGDTPWAGGSLRFGIISWNAFATVGAFARIVFRSFPDRLAPIAAPASIPTRGSSSSSDSRPPTSAPPPARIIAQNAAGFSL